MKNKWFKGVLLLMTGGIFLTSCYKSFDSKSYRPTFTVGGFASSAEVGAGHLVAYWAFDGSLIDSVSGTVGSAVNTGFSPGFKGQSLQGADKGYVISDLPTAIKNMKSFTVDFWINTAQPSGAIITPLCISNTKGFWGALDLYYESNNATASSANFKVHYTWQKDGFFTTAFLTNPWNAWQNIALTYDAASSTFNLYQGGSLVQGGTLTVDNLGAASFTPDANNIVFGTEQFQTDPSLGTAGGPQGWAGYLRGQLDEVRIYDVALPQADLKSLIILQGKGK